MSDEFAIKCTICGIFGCCYLARCFIDDDIHDNEICFCKKCREFRCFYFLPCFQDDGSIDPCFKECKTCWTPLDKKQSKGGSLFDRLVEEGIIGNTVISENMTRN